MQDWLSGGAESLLDRAHDRVKKILASHQPQQLDEQVQNELEQIMLSTAAKEGLDRLPVI